MEQGHVVDDVLVHGVPGRQRPVQLPHLGVRPAALAVEVAAEVKQAGGVLEFDRGYEARHESTNVSWRAHMGKGQK